MPKASKKNIAIIGCGNMAWHIANKFKGNFNLQVYNHKPNAILSQFAKEFKAQTDGSLSNINETVEVYFICVKDEFIIDTIKKLNVNSIILITSGNFDLETIPSSYKNCAIFYPLQTFTKNVSVNWSELNIIWESTSKKAEFKVKEIAKYIKPKSLIQLNYKKRLNIHLSAVLVNNFTNSLYVEADTILKRTDKKLDINILLPLIKQNILKLQTTSPKKAQTGPAKRKDKVVLKKHLSIIENKKVRELYKLFNSLINEQQDA